MRVVLGIVLFGSVTLAAADPVAGEVQVAARRAVPAVTADEALAWVRVADDPCHAGCTSKAVQSAPLAGGVRVEIRETQSDELVGPRLGIAIHAGDMWWAAPDEIQLVHFDCGAGHCNEITLDAVTISETNDIVWVRFDVANAHTFNDPEYRAMNHTTHQTIVVGCKLAAGAVTCASADSADEDGLGSVKMSGTAVTFTRAGAHSVTRFAF